MKKRAVKKTVAAVAEDPKEIYRRDWDEVSAMYQAYLQSPLPMREQEYLVVPIPIDSISPEEFRDEIGRARVRLRYPKTGKNGEWEEVYGAACNDLSKLGIVARVFVFTRTSTNRYDMLADFTDGHRSFQPKEK